MFGNGRSTPSISRKRTFNTMLVRDEFVCVVVVLVDRFLC
jgi:hypothetical protein